MHTRTKTTEGLLTVPAVVVIVFSIRSTGNSGSDVTMLKPMIDETSSVNILITQ